MKCLNCDNKAVGRSKYCSDKCKVAYNRNKSKAETVTDVTETGTVTEGMTMTPEGLKVKVPANYGLRECQCRQCQITRHQNTHLILNHGSYKDASKLAKNELNRVSLPSDVDYVGVFS